MSKLKEIAISVNKKQVLFIGDCTRKGKHFIKISNLVSDYRLDDNSILNLRDYLNSFIKKHNIKEITNDK